MSHQSSDFGQDEITRAPRAVSKRKKKPYSIEFRFKDDKEFRTWKRYRNYEAAKTALAQLVRKYPDWGFHIARFVTLEIEKHIITAPTRVLHSEWTIELVPDLIINNNMTDDEKNDIISKWGEK